MKSYAYIFAAILAIILIGQTNAQGKYKFRAVHDALKDADAVVIASLEGASKNKNQKYKIKEVLLGESEHLAKGKAITVRKVPIVPKYAMTWRVSKYNPNGQWNHTQLNNNNNRSSIMLFLSSKKIAEKDKNKIWEIETTGYLNAKKVLMNKTCYALSPDWGGNRIDNPQYAIHQLTETEARAHVKAEKLYRKFKAAKDNKEKAKIATEAIGIYGIGYTYANRFIKHVSQDTILKGFENEVKAKAVIRPNRSYNNKIMYDAIDRSRLSVQINNISKPNSKLFPLLNSTIKNHPNHAKHAIKKLGLCGNEALSALRDMLASSDHVEQAAMGLATINTDEAKTILEKDIRYDIIARPEGYSPVIVPPFAIRWPVAWEKLKEEMLAKEQDRERIRQYIKNADRMVEKSNIKF